MDELYDLIIVGAGPSAAGLLHSILTRLKHKKIDLRIAVVERGGTYQDNEPEPSLFEHGHKSTLHLQNWFTAAHYSNQSRSNHELPTALHTSAPQAHLHSRIVDVPTGRSWGGSTHINACLFVPPQ
jgi:choline dehydrogenase-like flavoprotein